MTLWPLAIAFVFFLSSILLWKGAYSFTIDAAPVGSMMIAASVLCMAGALFHLGIQGGLLLCH